MKKLLIASAALLTGCLTTTQERFRESGTRYAEEALAPYVKTGELPGAITIFYNDGVQETTCVGYADMEAKRPITLDDPYMQCSQTKGFCGVSIAMLVEEGRITLDDPVSKYLPEFATLWVQESNSNGVKKLVQAKNTLTIRMCLTHTGGFPFELANFHAMGGWARRMPLRSVAATAAAATLLFEPGTKVQYSNVGIDIGAAVVEQVTGKRWEEFLRERVLDPLEMKNTGFWPSDELLAHQIELYEAHTNAPSTRIECNASQQRPYNDDRVFPSAGAGIWTTARDQVKFYKMLMNLGIGENGVRILKEESVKEMLAKSVRPEAVARKYGGWALGLHAPIVDSENEWFGHGGAWRTSCLVNWHKRQLKLTAVQLCGKEPSRWNAALGKAAEKFFSAKLDAKGEAETTGRLQ